MRYAFFPGCSLESTSRDYDRSTRAVCRALGIELAEIPDWVCCGSTPAHSTNQTLAVSLPVLNLQKAEALGVPVMAACASCYARLRTANHEVRSHEDQRARAERVTEKPYDGRVEVRHVLDVLIHDVGIDAIRRRVTYPLRGLKVACYYGCLLSRPPKVVAFDNPDHPSCMEQILEAAGANCVEWPYRTECCGAGLSVPHTDVVARLAHRLLSMARTAGAECIAVACPMCQVNLDLRQSDATKAHGPLPETPVPYLTQLLGMAFGLESADVGLDALIVPPTGVVGHQTQATVNTGSHGSE